MKIEQMTPFPENCNAFHHDLYHMGVHLGKNCTIMMPNHNDVDCKYFIVVNTKTGERMKVRLVEEETTPMENFADNVMTIHELIPEGPDSWCDDEQDFDRIKAVNSDI